MCSRRNFCLVHNLIRHIISPNQDDLSYSVRTTFLGSSIWGKPSNTLFHRTTSFCTDVYCLISYSSSSSIAPWGKQSNSWTPWLFFLDQGFLVEYELDKFNTPHTGTTLCHPQNWVCRLRCRIPLRHLATTSPWGNIFWRHSRFFPKQPETQTYGDFNVSLLKQQTRLLLNHGEHIPLARPTTRAAFSTLS